MPPTAEQFAVLEEFITGVERLTRWLARVDAVLARVAR